MITKDNFIMEIICFCKGENIPYKYNIDTDNILEIECDWDFLDEEVCIYSNEEYLIIEYEYIEYCKHILFTKKPMNNPKIVNLHINYIGKYS